MIDQVAAKATDEWKALQYFDAHSLREAADSARQFLASVPSCQRCLRVLSLLHERLGSTLFRDDDPKVLAESFDAADRHVCTLKLLAACIVLFGRRRVAVDAGSENGIAPTVELPILIWSDGGGVTVACPALPGSLVHSGTRATALRELRRIVWRRLDRGELLAPPRVDFEPFELPCNAPAVARLGRH